jgi:hypothetical protein
MEPSMLKYKFITSYLSNIIGNCTKLYYMSRVLRMDVKGRTGDGLGLDSWEIRDYVFFLFV